MDTNKLPENSPDINPIEWKSRGFSSQEGYLIFVFKKTQKIVSAIYLISGLIKDDDPIKWELRSRSLEMLSTSFNVSNLLSEDRNLSVQSLFTAASELTSLLNVSKISGLISEMNHYIITKEINLITNTLQDKLSKSAESAGYVLSESFFRTSEGFSADLSGNKKTISSFYAEKQKGQKKEKNYQNIDFDSSTKIKKPSEDKKTKRQEDILNLLKERSDLSVKDFTYVIKDCSEKTVQRELLEMVDKGIIKKQGERRWSRYSLS